MIYDDIVQFKNYTGGAVNYSVELSSLEPTMLTAARQHLIPWLTAAVWDEVLAIYEADTPSTEEAALLDHTRRALAMLTMYEYVRIGGIQFSEAGIMRAETENMKSAYKYQENAYKEYMQEHGFNALETLLEYLDANADAFETWRDGGGRSRYRSTLLHRHTDITDITGRNVSRFTFHILRPVIGDLELFALVPILGEAALDDLRLNFIADDMSEPETTLLGLCRKVLAHFAIAEGVSRLYVQVKGDRVVQTETAEQQGARKEAMPTTDALGLLMQLNSDWANRHFSYLRNFLDNNATDFPLYEAYRAEQLEEAAEADHEANDERATIYPHSGAVDRRDYRPAQPKGTVRL